MGCCYPVGKNCKVQFPSDPSVSRRISNESALLVFYQLVGLRGYAMKVPDRPNKSLQRTRAPLNLSLGPASETRCSLRGLTHLSGGT